MRISQSTYYNNFQYDQRNVNKELYESTKRISSGIKIQYGYEDSSVFVDTLRLDNELQNLNQVKDNSQNAKLYSDNTDTILSQMSSGLEQFKTKMLSAANENHSQESRDALAKELSSLREHIRQLGNTSIDGKYLFSGTSVGTIPVNGDGEYQGNNEKMNAFFGSNVRQDYNITGLDLFLGEDTTQSKSISTNVKNYNMSKLHPDPMQGIKSDILPEEVYIRSDDTIRDLVGDDPNSTANTNFYIKGRDSSGEIFEKQVNLSDGSKVEDLLEKIGLAFGNTADTDVVDVTINDVGQFEVKDKKNGSSQIEFHMFSSRESDPANIGTTDAQVKYYTTSKEPTLSSTSSVQSQIDQFNPQLAKMPNVLYNKDGNLANKDTNLQDIFGSNVNTLDIGGNTVNVNGTTTVTDILNAINTAGAIGPGSGYQNAGISNGVISMQVDNKRDINSPFDWIRDYDGGDISINALDSSGNPTDAFAQPDGVEFDKRKFDVNGSVVLGNMRQTLKSDNSYAIPSTKLSEVSSGVNTLDGTVLNFQGTNIDGNQFDVKINLNNAGSTFDYTDSTGTTNSFNILNGTGGNTSADDVTYQQLFDIMGMVTSNTIPATNTNADYETALRDYKQNVSVGFDQEGRLKLNDLSGGNTKISFGLYDSRSDDNNYNNNSTSLMLFNTNNALTINNPKINLFSQLADMIRSVQTGRVRADGDELLDPRSDGIQNGISKLDQLMSHVESMHTINGSQGQSLQHTIERNEILIVNTQILRSDVLDTDMAEESMRMQQLSLNYQALLSTVSKVQQLSLVKYL